MRIGVVADNHGLIDRALEPLLRNVDEIWHAGDLVTPDIIGVLSSWAPLRVVRGNNDVSKRLRTLPEEEAFECEGLRVLLRHIVGPADRIAPDARESIRRLGPHVVVMGHSHRPQAEVADGRLFLNPGSCGPRRFSLPRSAAILHLSPTLLRFEVSDLDAGKAILEEEFVVAHGRIQGAARDDRSPVQPDLFIPD